MSEGSASAPRPTRGLAALALLGVIALATGWLVCRDASKASTTNGVASASVNDRFGADEQRAVEAVKAQITARAAPAGSELVPGRSNAEVFAYIAETSDDPAVIAAALRETLGVYSSRSSQKRAPDADLERVLLKHLRSSDPTILGAALAAARIPLMTATPSPAITQAITESTRPERGAAERAAALEALALLRPDRRDATVLAAFEQALSAAEPELLSLALLALSQSGASLGALPEDARARLAALVVALGAHPNPGVRGRSLAVLAELTGLLSAEARFAAGRQHLADSDGYVRAQAADLLLRCREPMAIHALIDSVRDLAPARYELRGFTNLDGSAGVLLHVVPGRPRVADAALFAMLNLSQELPGVTPLVLTLAGVAPESVVLQNATTAELWYRTESARIPRAPSQKTP